MTPSRAREVTVEASPWSARVVVFTDVSADLEAIDGFRDTLRELRPSLVFVLCNGGILDVGRFLTCLSTVVPVALVDASMPTAALSRLVQAYTPELVVGLGATSCELSGYRLTNPHADVWVSDDSGPSVHRDLAVLLSTSGSTGGARFVRLSRENLLINAEQIQATLHIRSTDRALASLPVPYALGMSVVTSHVFRGASLVLPTESVVSETFWREATLADATFLPAVPQTLAALRRIGFQQRRPTSLSVVAQAGGKAYTEDILYTLQAMDAARGRLHIMYGQAEASPRIACLPAGDLPRKLGSVGLAVPGGAITIVDTTGNELPHGSTGEIIYHGPNVMMGYATSRSDLARGDESGGRLATGDLGFLDDEGFLFIEGRKSRIAKLASKRVALDDIEELAHQELGCPVAVIPSEYDGIEVFAVTDSVTARGARSALARSFGVPATSITVHQVSALPLLSNGKVDYMKLAGLRAKRE